jgi:hypothetical protein
VDAHEVDFLQEDARGADAPILILRFGNWQLKGG